MSNPIKVSALILFGAVVMSACDGETPSDTGASSSSSSSSSASSSSGEGGAGGAGGGCVSDPKTHVEIINACTDAEKVGKVVNLPLLNADGTLPPLP
jgi:hypothetical protein